MTIACDLDGTLTSGQMGQGVGRYLAEHGQKAAYQRFTLTHLPHYLLAKLKLADVRGFKKRWALDMVRLFQGMDVATLTTMFEAVAEGEIWAKRRPDVVAELQALQAQGRRVVVVSGSYEMMIAPVARRIGAEALGTALEIRDGVATGRILGQLNVGASKVERLKTWLNGQPLTYAYGDSLDDLPMLELAENPVAVHPDEKLRRVALERGWRIME